jgi:hypothetical protein
VYAQQLSQILAQVTRERPLRKQCKNKSLPHLMSFTLTETDVFYFARQIKIWVSLFGLAAAIGSFRSGWKATVLPPPPSPPPAESPSVSEPKGEGTSTESDTSQVLPADTGYNTDERELYQSDSV